MARYIEKTEADLAWDKIRREVQYKVNLAAAHYRAEMLNRILPRLQDEFERQLNSGTLLLLEESAESWLDEMIEELDA